MFGDNLELFDVTMPFSSDFPVWPGDPAIELRPLQRMESGDSCNVTQIVCPTHCGTHVDPPRHFIAGGATMSDIPISRWIGPCQVVEINNTATGIGPDQLNGAGIRPGVERLLLKTANSEKWNHPPYSFDPNYAALTLDGAQWLLDHDVKLIGIDYLSFESFDGDGQTHRLLLGNDVLAIEGLDLRAVDPGDYLLLCLPLKLQDGDGAQARVVLARAR